MKTSPLQHQAQVRSRIRTSRHDIGFYGQTAFSPTEWLEVRTACGTTRTRRGRPTATQVSPRIRLNLYPSTSTTAYVYYGRVRADEIEDLRAITSAAQGGMVDLPTTPQRDHFFEVGSFSDSRMRAS